MNEAEIEALLADFRSWLTTPPELPPETNLGTLAPASPVGLMDAVSILEPFTALRQEINLLTKSTRATLEQNAAALDELRKPIPTPPTVITQPLLKALIEVADALAAAAKQLDKAKTMLQELPSEVTLQELPETPETAAPTARVGFWGRLFGSTPTPSTDWETWAAEVISIHEANVERVTEAEQKFTPMLAGLADGYLMSLRRIERLLPQYDLEAIPVLGKPFDPEEMEAVEVVERPPNTDSGVVVEELRRGYRRAGAVMRYALVKVSR